jgi:MFS family permease
MVMLMTISERAPFLGLALIAWFGHSINPEVALTLGFLFLIWGSLGGGLTANAWQSMIAKIIPAQYRGTFLGGQAAFANITLSIGAIAAGYILHYFDADPSIGFALCFGLTSLFMFVSWIFLNLTREPVDYEKHVSEIAQPFWRGSRTLLNRDINFRWFILVRILSQFAMMGSPFYIVFALRRFDMDNITAGFLTAALTIAQTLANAGMGYFGDRFGHRLMLMIGIIAGGASALVAWWAPSLIWFYLVYFLAGMANVAMWTTSMAFIVQFGTEPDRPLYIGLANTLIAPASILAPLLGGFLVDAISFEVTFILSIIISLMTLRVLYLFVKNPHRENNFTE